MSDIEKMSMEDLLGAIDFCEETYANLTSHGQTDDYLVGSQKMVEIYRQELDRRIRQIKGDNRNE